MALVHYDVDFVHSWLGFSVRHLMITRVHGAFTRWNGTFAIDHEEPARSSLAVEVDATSVDTRNAQRDAHLRSPDFFDVERFSSIKFQSHQVTPLGDGFRVTGDFTLRGVTHPLTFQVQPGGQARDSQGRARVGYQATSSISRAAFGLAWNAVYEGGSVVVGDEVALVLDLQLIPRAVPAAP